MKPIATPAFRPTADCIFNAFLSSSKRHLILTGERNNGKSTIFQQLCPHGAPGLKTFALPEKKVHMVENGTGAQAVIGTFDPGSVGDRNRMRICHDGFLSVGLPALDRLIRAEGHFVYIDEIGYLECQCDEYIRALQELFAKKSVIAVVRKQDLPFLNELRTRSDAFCVDLDAPFGKLGCVIMASGMGTRFGGNKLTADFCGRPMFFNALDATEGIFLRRTVVTRHPEVAELCRRSGIDFVIHNEPYRSDTVRIGIETMPDVEGCLFCPADQPLLRRVSVASLAIYAACDPFSIVRTCFNDRPGSPVLFPKWAFDVLKSLPQGQGGSHLLKKYPDRIRMIPVGDEFELWDADTRKMFEKLIRLHKSESSKNAGR